MIRHAVAPVVPRAALALGIERTLPTETAAVALTFDDGPHPEGTPAILELLAQAQLRATFFMVGEQVERRPELAAEVVTRGHAIALHCHRHRLQLRLPRSAIAEDLSRGEAAIAKATGVRPKLHRPPYGIYSATGLTVALAAGMKPLLWSRWGKDWRKFTTPERIAARVTRQLAPGDVILLHDADFYGAKGSHLNSASALELIVADLDRRGLGATVPWPHS
jgi:peptidoglycan-N-acetylglucosamine deacetylase